MSGGPSITLKSQPIDGNNTGNAAAQQQQQQSANGAASAAASGAPGAAQNPGNGGAVGGASGPAEGSRQNSLQRIQQRKQKVFNLPVPQKLAKLSMYSACQSEGCRCTGWKTPQENRHRDVESSYCPEFNEECRNASCRHSLRMHIAHLDNISSSSMDELLGAIIDMENLFMSMQRVEDEDTLNVTVINQGIGVGKINEDCGADYVKVQQRPPKSMPEVEPFTRCVSVDGDADRVVYFFSDDKGEFHLLDGDRIATLIAGYLMDLVKQAEISLRLGLVQTAYANGASTDYIVDELKFPVSCVPTGVKHLHHKALEYDIGVYFEANGHGTIVFSDNAKATIAQAAETKESAKTLLLLIDLINETVGDAISDMLLVETILNHKGWDVQDWISSYKDLPNRQLKVKVQDRNVIETTDAERVCVKPEGLQTEINNVVANYKRGRSFVRPSGTEDVVRVYAEAATKEVILYSTS